MLIQQQQQQQAVRPAKQIAIRCNTENAVIYTVPKGRKFIGACYYGASNSITCYINGISLGRVYTGGADTNVASTLSYPNALTLLEGATISFNSAGPVILGVEYDA